MVVIRLLGSVLVAFGLVIAGWAADAKEASLAPKVTNRAWPELDAKGGRLGAFVVLPKIETAGKSKMIEQIEIGISPEGQFFFNGEPLTRPQIEAAIKLAASFDKDALVLILADEESYLKHITFVMDTCRKAGLDRIRLQSR